MGINYLHYFPTQKRAKISLDKSIWLASPKISKIEVYASNKDVAIKSTVKSFKASSLAFNNDSLALLSNPNCLVLFKAGLEKVFSSIPILSLISLISGSIWLFKAEIDNLLDCLLLSSLL